MCYFHAPKKQCVEISQIQAAKVMVLKEKKHFFLKEMFRLCYKNQDKKMLVSKHLVWGLTIIKKKEIKCKITRLKICR